MRGSLRERFEDKVERIPFHTCWEWVGATQNAGYGHLSIGGRRGTVLAHRVAYRLYVSPIPTGLQIDHLCGNKLCVNPDHLEAVTPKTNTQRYLAARPPQHSFRCGHPFEPSNQYILTNGSKYCRRCHLVRTNRPKHAS